jgi:hypothetical protein
MDAACSMRRVGQEINAYKISDRKPGGKKPLGTSQV